MPITLDLSRTTPAEVRFVVSPLVELGSAWHVLIGLDHHDAAWANRARIPAKLLRRLADWSFAARAVRATLLADPTLVPPDRWDNQLATISRLPALTFATALLRPLLRTKGRSASLTDDRVRTGVLALARARGPAVLGVVRQILADPDSARADFVDLLDQSWSAFFADEWSRVYPLLRDEAHRRSRLTTRHGLAQGLAGLPAITAEPAANRIVIDKVNNKRLTVAGRGLILMGTALCDGHVYVADEPGRPITVHYPTIPGGYDAEVRTTLRRLTVLANPARMEICRAIAVEPRSAREIARLWGLAESAVTKHLSTLRTAGLVHTERSGHYVRYTLDSAAVADLGTHLLEVLRR